MNRTDLLQMVSAGENSRVEFKRDDVQPAKLAARIAGLLNLDGGHVLLGVEDDGSISGLTRSPKEAEEWVMQIARDHLQPSVIPIWEVFDTQAGAVMGVIALPSSAPDKPYKVRQGSTWVTKVRVGTTTRDATREEEQRLYQQSGGVHYGLKPVAGSSPTDLDHRRLQDYFSRIRGDQNLSATDSPEWRQLLCNLELAVELDDAVFATVDGILLFGTNVRRFLPQSGVRAVRFEGREPDYASHADEDIKGALAPLVAADGSVVETGIVERVIDFVHRTTDVQASLVDGRRVQRRDFPDQAVREIVVNALIHRDYSISGTDVLLSIFDDRLEIQSPGRLPNSVSVDGIRSGARYARNQLLVSFMRDYGYVEALGMGIRRKAIPSMAEHNGTEPDFIEEEHRFTVRLWK